MKYDNRKSGPTAEQIAVRKQFVTKGMIMTADAGGPVVLVKSRADSPLDDAIARMNKMRAMAEQITTALRQRH